MAWDFGSIPAQEMKIIRSKIAGEKAISLYFLTVSMLIIIGIALFSIKIFIYIIVPLKELRIQAVNPAIL